MVGMSGKASEPRRGHATQQKKSSAGHAGLGKTQPPPEALHVANILGDGVYPADLPDKMAQVMAMLPSCAEEEVCIALHDHDFDTERAITALLDRDLLSGSQGEWMTKKGRRSKGGDGSSDFIIAPGDSRLPGRQGGRGTNRAASQSAREGYGGSVSVGSEGGRGRGSGGRGEGGRERGSKGRGGSSGRGRSSSSSGRRDREERDNKKEERVKGERGSRGRNRGPRGAKARARQAAAVESEKVGEELRAVEDKTLPVTTESWDDLDPRPSTEWDDRGSPASHTQLEPPPVVAEQMWDSEAESKSSQTLFPEAFSEPNAGDGVPAGPLAVTLASLPTSSSAQPTALAATTPPLPLQTTPLPLQTTPGGSVPHQMNTSRRPTTSSCSQQTAPVEFHTASSSSVSSSHSTRLRSRHRRLARSQIPSQPVEMPKGSLPELSELGIAFGGLDLQTTPVSGVASTSSSDSPSSQPPEGLLAATPTCNEARYQNEPVTSAPLTFSTQFPEDSGVISIATTTTTSYGGSVKKLEAPPGLPHPMSMAQSTSATGSLPHSVIPALPHSVVPSGSVPHSVVPSGSLPHSVVPSGSVPHSVVHSGSLPHSVVPSLPHSVVPSGSVPSGSLSASGSLPHTATLVPTVPLTTTTQDSSVSTTGHLPPTTSVTQTAAVVGKLLSAEAVSLSPGAPTPPSSLLSPIDQTQEHTKSAVVTVAASSSSQLLSYSMSGAGSSATTGGGASELLSSQAAPTCSSMATPTSKTLTSQSSHHHGNPQQLSTSQQGGSSKHSSLQQQQQQQQQLIYPYMLQPPLVMPMSAYYDPDMSRFQASVSMAYYQHPTSSDPAMATGMGRDHVGSGFTGDSVGAGKFGGRGTADISTSTTASHSQQGVQQSQLSHAAVFNPYYGGNVIYPMYPGYGVPGFSHSIPKQSGGSSYPGGGVNSYQPPSGAGFGYEEVGTAADYKMYGGMASGALGKPHPLTSSTGDLPAGAGYKPHSGFDSGKTSYSTYSVPQGGYGFIPTGPMPLQMPPNYITEGGAGGGRSQKHSKQYSGSHGSSQLWSQQPGH